MPGLRAVQLLFVIFILTVPGLSVVDATFGVHKTAQGCAADHAAHDDNYLSGKWEPFFTTGPPDECDTDGCLDGFWAPQSRFQVEPTCPKALVAELTAWLRQLNKEGSWWAHKALILQPCDLWDTLKGRTVWVIGDSVTEDIGHAMAQMMLEYWDKPNWNETISNEPHMDEALNHGAAEGLHHLYKRVPYWCFVMGSPQERSRICYIKADQAKRGMHVLGLMPKLAAIDDIVLFNLGIHYNNMYQLEEDMTMVASALTQTGLPKNVFWVETAPQHFDTPDGMFNMSKQIKDQVCKPAAWFFDTEVMTFANGSLGIKPGHKHDSIDLRENWALHRLIAGGERNLATQPIIDSFGIPTLRLWNITLPLHKFHTHVHSPHEPGECTEVECDCTHSCHPSWSQLILVHFMDLVEKHAAKMHHRQHVAHRHQQL